MPQFHILLLSAVFLLIFLVLYYLVRRITDFQKKKDERESGNKTEVGFVVDTFHDLVSKLKKKEKELETLKSMAEERASSIELYNENILQSVSSGVISFDKELRITRINAAALTIFGLREKEVRGKECREIFNSPIFEMISEERMIEGLETAYVVQGGKRLWIGVTLSPLRDRSGRVIGQILVITDLTELKAFQSQMELRERLSTLGEMSAGIAHELRNPMAVISGYTKLLLKKVDDSMRTQVLAISKEVEVMDRIITDFLSFAKPTELMFSKIDITDLIRGCVEPLSDSLGNMNLKLEIGGLPLIKADEVLLRQAITNLVQNAAEAMTDGGELVIKGIVDQDVCITIQDSGHGIPENIRDKIFLPFFSTKERGTGLGLSIVHKIVVSHGGTIKADSSSKGTVFTIRLPKELIAASG